MTCNHLSELRKQMNEMQTLLDTYEHCHVDSVTPEEKIVENTKAKCIEVADKIETECGVGEYVKQQVIKAIQGV